MGKLGNRSPKSNFCFFIISYALILEPAKRSSMIKLIIVDDHFHVREAWSWVLNQVPGLHVIAQCANGQEAIEAAKQLRPDVMLMDINMHPVNGMEATREIRGFAPDIKII